jgi:hypothetical protein
MKEKAHEKKSVKHPNNYYIRTTLQASRPFNPLLSFFLFFFFFSTSYIENWGLLIIFVLSVLFSNYFFN